MAPSPPSRQEEVDRVFDAFGHYRRRFVLRYLKQQPSPVALDRLAAAVTAWEFDATEDFPAEEYGRVRATLHHVHLPKLARAGLADYDCERNVAEAVRYSADEHGPMAIAGQLVDYLRREPVAGRGT